MSQYEMSKNLLKDGFSELEGMFNGFLNTSVEKFPYFNLYKSTLGLSGYDDEITAIEVAVAGFTEEELSVSEEAGYLVIEGNKAVSELDQNATHFQAFKGITSRKFKRVFHIGMATVQDVELAYGILKITLKPKGGLTRKALPIKVK